MDRDDRPSSRRKFLRTAISIVPAFVAPLSWKTGIAAMPVQQLAFVHTLFHDELIVQYRAGDIYEPGALAQVNQFLRDPLTNEVCAIDPALLDFLHDAYVLTRSRGVFEVISGYRSPATNAMMRRKNRW